MAGKLTGKKLKYHFIFEKENRLSLELIDSFNGESLIIFCLLVLSDVQTYMHAI